MISRQMIRDQIAKLRYLRGWIASMLDADHPQGMADADREEFTGKLSQALSTDMWLSQAVPRRSPVRQ